MFTDLFELSDIASNTCEDLLVYGWEKRTGHGGLPDTFKQVLKDS